MGKQFLRWRIQTTIAACTLAAVAAAQPNARNIMKIRLLPALCLLAGMAHADTTVRVDVVTDPDTRLTSLTTRSFEPSIGHTFTDSSHASAYLTGILGRDESYLDVVYSGDGWRYFDSAHDADGSALPFAALDRHVAGSGHIIEHFHVGLSRAFLQNHISQGANISFAGKSESIIVALPAVFIHDYLEESDKAMSTAAAQGVASVKLHFGAEYLPLEPAFARILGLPTPQGLLVTSVLPGSVAAHTGLQQGDVILQFGDKVVNSVDDLEQAVAAVPAGGSTHLRVWRAGAVNTVPASF